uniref:Uncharacterized protein n=1 Tax=Anguilla anguilla TaxID=7936 RepID=A0A0E9S7J2_ANGAN
MICYILYIIQTIPFAYNIQLSHKINDRIFLHIEIIIHILSVATLYIIITYIIGY